jgi:hypothetical protein
VAKRNSIDLTEVLKKYKGAWVALNRERDKVVAKAKTPRQALKEARRQGYSDPLIFWATKNYGGVVPVYA